ncbi:leukocyte immunoglobulin-like receptor subfamily A member 5, partial [Nannospalax galili]|uniref:leukocyte immunoglobulin-like receptor subfamily A member 5 n=1 Tax=Nannospalax galili TaxID=1026970 RepID=UPI00111C4413
MQHIELYGMKLVVWPNGMLPEPTIRVEPCSVVPKGTQVTISCEGTTGATEYCLYKDEKQYPLRQNTPVHTGNKAHFLIPSIELHHAGRYQCHYHSPDGWSEHSDFLELVVTGIYNSKPWLSAQPSPVASPGEKLMLHCVSQEGYDRFILTEEGEQNHLRSLDSQHVSIRKFQALFPVGPVTPSSNRTFRCYGSYKRYPQVWSEPSDPLEIHIPGNSNLSTGPILTAGLGSYQMILIGVSVFFLLFLLIFLLLRWRCQHKCRKDDASLKIPQPKGSVEPDSLNPPDEDPVKEMYAQVKPSRLRRAGATSPPSTFSREFLSSKNRESEDRERDSE